MSGLSGVTHRLTARAKSAARRVRAKLPTTDGSVRLLPGRPVEFASDLPEAQSAKIAASVLTTGTPNKKGAVLTATFRDAQGAVIAPPYDGWSASRSFDAFVYLETVRERAEGKESDGKGLGGKIVRVPPGARSAVFLVHAWKDQGRLRLSAPPRVVGEADDAADAKGQAGSAGGKAQVYQQKVMSDALIEFGVMMSPGRAPDPKGALLRVEFYDEAGDYVTPPYVGLAASSLGAYRYLAVGGSGASRRAVAYCQPPRGAATVRFEVKPWGQKAVRVEGTPQFRATSYEAASASFASAVRAGEAGLGLSRAFADLAHARGDQQGRILALAAINKAAPSAKAEAQLRHAVGAARETDPSFMPCVPGPPERAPDPGSKPEGAVRVCHLMKVCRPFENTGGAVRNANTVLAQRAAGLDPYVVTPLGYPGTKDAARSTMLGDVPHYHLAPTGLGGGAGNLPRDRALELEAAMLGGVFRRFGGHLVHAASGYRGYDNALKGLALSRHFGVPWIYEVRSLHEHTWAPMRADILDAPMTRDRMAQEDRCMNAADHVVTIAQTMRGELVRRGVPEEKITVIPNAVEADWFEPVPEAEVTALRERLGFGGKTVVGYVSNLSGREGHAVLLRAYAILRAERPSLRLLIVGDGAERAALETLAADLGVSFGVTFTGNVPHEDVKAYYRAIDLFVVPRVADFASDLVTPMKPFEAMATERPLIMSDRPVTVEVIGEEARGRTFRAGEPEHLASVMRAALDEEDATRGLVREARRWVEAERTWAANARAYVQLYDRILAEHRARS